MFSFGLDLVEDISPQLGPLRGFPKLVQSCGEQQVGIP